jgi:hypothetical protein
VTTPPKGGGVRPLLILTQPSISVLAAEVNRRHCSLSPPRERVAEGGRSKTRRGEVRGGRACRAASQKREFQRRGRRERGEKPRLFFSKNQDQFSKPKKSFSAFSAVSALELFYGPQACLIVRETETYRRRRSAKRPPKARSASVAGSGVMLTLAQ